MGHKRSIATALVGGWVLLSVTAPILAQPPSVSADILETNDGNSLLKVCRDALAEISSDSPLSHVVEFHAAWCIALLEGVIDTVREIKAPLWCIPTNATPMQWIRVVVKYLDDNPAQLHRKRVPLIMMALHQAFPCSKHR